MTTTRNLIGAAIAAAALASCAAEPVRASYVEARTCTVFGGACHANGEALSQGRHAVSAWRFESGAPGGALVVASIEADDNLGREDVARRAGLWVDAPSERARAAAVAEVTRASRLEPLSVRDAEIEWSRSGEGFRVAIDGVLELEGAALADRACCTMPDSVWYEPLAPVEGAVVGHPTQCRFEGSDGLSPWTYSDANSAFVASYQRR